ncbi:protein-disulfide reductase DsbD family protein [Erythrobacter sp. sf7]|uniref:Protein-disulfide reductase DsbD family protein n=1 Tax=Erythrobacter fulvus TaxID=2987523 RepID=A0ABT5JQY0_9SPHN|nr:protein-disulfide reductase DsbD [Erythrobacter fulvus]MDC8754496.1 protein-disulfide reductase DsbD family protein [Erythrobacter fulvus]
MSRARNFPLPIRQFAAWVLALVASVLLAGAAHAQDAEPDAGSRALYGDGNIAVALFADGAPKPGGEWMLALRFTPKSEEWHGYWSNPGDAGQGMRLTLGLPAGWEAGEPLYPVPQRLTISGLMNHVYEGQYAVLVPVKVPADASLTDVRPITGHVEYLACTDQICVPQDAVLKATMGGDFARWRASIAPLLDARGAFAIAGQTLRIGIPLPAGVALADPHVFISNERLVEYAAPQTFRRAGDLLVAEIQLDERRQAVEAVSGILSFGDGAGVRFAAAAGDVPTNGEVIAGAQGAVAPPLWTLILGALAGGLLLNIMPCVFPILSLKALSLARAGESEARARAEGLAYTAGVVLACVALGALMLALRAAGEQVGWAFQLQEPGVVVALLVLAAAITANFAGLYELPSLSVSMGGERTGAFATGLLAAFVATPCTGPFMAAALGAALLLPVGQALLLFALLGLGLALPFLALGFVPPLRRMLPKPGAWMERFRRIMVIPMGLTALALVWLTTQLGGQAFGGIALLLVIGVLIALWIVGRLQRGGKMAWPAFALVAAPFIAFAAIALPNVYEAKGSEQTVSIHAPTPFSRDALAEARASGQPVFLWFTADWCVTCKVNEATAIERESVRDAFEAAGVVTMIGDWTVRDPEITAFLTEQGAAGVPLYLWYAPGASAPEQLPQVLTTDLLETQARANSGTPPPAASAAGSD